MTEEEAKTKVCHRSLGLQPIVDWDATRRSAMPGSHILASGGQANCIGSACMAWRWSGHRTDYDEDVNASYPKVGFCGLAGKP